MSQSETRSASNKNMSSKSHKSIGYFKMHLFFIQQYIKSYTSHSKHSWAEHLFSFVGQPLAIKPPSNLTLWYTWLLCCSGITLSAKFIFAFLSVSPVHMLLQTILVRCLWLWSLRTCGQHLCCPWWAVYHPSSIHSTHMAPQINFYAILWMKCVPSIWHSLSSFRISNVNLVDLKWSWNLKRA